MLLFVSKRRFEREKITTLPKIQYCRWNRVVHIKIWGGMNNSGKSLVSSCQSKSDLDYRPYLIVPSTPYYSGICLTCLLKCCHANSLAPVNEYIFFNPLIKKNILISLHVPMYLGSKIEYLYSHQGRENLLFFLLSQRKLTD